MWLIFGVFDGETQIKTRKREWKGGEQNNNKIIKKVDFNLVGWAIINIGVKNNDKL